ncbi:class I SAM-dependent methyltransferase [Rossellomorea vietnamensis]|uniref:Class I SAM-dependent methyltransferase n=1 Tax=Rossellomorea vietnamensis TaxID=218284 RepID=A0A5D4MHN3_9BACI|nr:methyltransferase domain-containing protein [Rossellomorea vietnamensis]TYS01415.1 class I SAM-dependent methyltransferase [Rossellomorea vietnamensis]
MKEMIKSNEDVLVMLDELLHEEKKFNWDTFYEDRTKRVPFFKDIPDENLVSYLDKGTIKAGKALELGCGPGRNAIYLAENGFLVDAVDSSQEGLQWAKERAYSKGVKVNFIKQNIFCLEYEAGTYDLVYDSGCFHHIPPHRRTSYLEIIERALKPGGHFALTTFVEGGELGGSEISDWDVYRFKSLKGGLGYSEEKLKTVFDRFEPLEVRLMKEKSSGSGMFGVTGLRTALFRKMKIDSSAE